ncbi:unnamed protein product [Linum trigynum]|uniref:Response regulatory domain-containing protein n=1 Tax=Linum trigynum TaxID=586398 RepID=A0AAV2CL00_9ROSI
MARNGVVASQRWRSDGEISSQQQPAHDSAAKEVHVLAVDDSLIDRKVIERLLRNSSYKVTAVDSGIRALQFLGLDGEEKKTSSIGAFDSLKIKVDLIITDYCMPEMTGYDLLKKIKGSSTLREIPVVIMSSENVVTRIDRCLEEGAEDFIVKPVKASDVERLRGYMETTSEPSVRVNKRKQRESCESCNCLSTASSTSSSPISSSSPSPSPSPPPTSMSSSSPSSTPMSMSVPSSPSPSQSPSPATASAPCSPSLLDSPTRRLKMSSPQEE